MRRIDPWFVYIIECADGSLYTGVARSVEERLRQHNGEKRGGPRYTRGRRPVTLVFTEQVADRSAAQQREAQIKALSREQKLQLIRDAAQP